MGLDGPDGGPITGAPPGPGGTEGARGGVCAPGCNEVTFALGAVVFLLGSYLNAALSESMFEKLGLFSLSKNARSWFGSGDSVLGNVAENLVLLGLDCSLCG